jgi:hypothetical protein
MGIFNKIFGTKATGADGGASEFKALLDASMEELRLKTAAHQQGWGFGKASRWDLDQSLGNLVFTFADGITAVCPAQIIGSFDSKTGEWLWAWANPSIAEPLKRDSLKIKEYGKQNRIAKLTSDEWFCQEEDAWQMTALACKLCEAQGGYRGPAGTTFVFMTFGKVELSRK